MNLSAFWRLSLLLLVFTIAVTGSSVATASVDTAMIAETVKTDVAKLIAGINAHDVGKATAYDAPNVIFMECGSAPTIGVIADREAYKAHFAQDPNWRVSLINETVDVSSSGDLAVYRGTYNEDSVRAGVPITHKTNFIAEFKHQGDGSWQIDWEIVSNMEKSHPK